MASATHSESAQYIEPKPLEREELLTGDCLYPMLLSRSYWDPVREDARQPVTRAVSPADHCAISTPGERDVIQCKVKGRDLRGPRIRRFPCNICSAMFERPSSLQQHVRTHTGEKPFVCSLCGKEFSVSSNARRHDRNCHPREPTMVPKTDKRSEALFHAFPVASPGTRYDHNAPPTPPPAGSPSPLRLLRLVITTEESYPSSNHSKNKMNRSKRPQLNIHVPPQNNSHHNPFVMPKHPISIPMHQFLRKDSSHLVTLSNPSSSSFPTSPTSTLCHSPTWSSSPSSPETSGFPYDKSTTPIFMRNGTPNPNH